MHESIDVILRYSVRDPLRSRDMDVLEIEVPREDSSADSLQLAS